MPEKGRQFMARVEPIPVRKWPKDMRSALAAMVPPAPRHPQPVQKDRPKALNALGTFAHYPALAQAFFTFNGHVLMATTLTQRQREILVLRVAKLRECDYEWAQHVIVGRDVGLSDEEIERIASGPHSPGWDPIDAALLHAVDELVVDGVIGDETWAALSDVFDTRQLMDLIFTVGAYMTVALLMRSFAFDLDDDLRP
jgi:alkylhydroperoxidase family enzyme